MTAEFDRYDAFEKEMQEKFPKMFTEPYGGFCCGEGWWPILRSLCGQIQHQIDWKAKQGHAVPQVVVTQIKEKFGGLRFYYDGGNEYIDGLVSMAESWADYTCETCGEPARKKTTGYIKTVCDKHYEEFNQYKKGNQQ